MGSTIPNFQEDESRLGLLAGCDFRIPDRKVQLIPGIFYSNVQSDLVSSKDPLKDPVVKTIDISRIRVPLRLGMYFNNPDDLVRWRLNAGVQWSYLMSVSSDTPEISKNTFNTTSMDAVAGVGVDVIWLTFDLNYNYGLSDVLVSNDSRANVVTATVGLALKARK